MGQRALNVAEVILENVVVPRENLLGNEGDGFRLAMESLDEGRVNIATVSVGIARAAYEAALAYAKTRVQFGKPIGTNQAVSFMLADMAAAVDSARLLTWYAGSLADQGKRYTLQAAQAKFYASDVAMRGNDGRRADSWRLWIRQRVRCGETDAGCQAYPDLRRHQPDQPHGGRRRLDERVGDFQNEPTEAGSYGPAFYRDFFGNRCFRDQPSIPVLQGISYRRTTAASMETPPEQGG